MRAETIGSIAEANPGNFTEGYDRNFFRKISEVEDKHFWFSSRNRLIRRVLKRYTPEAVNFLEIGCGTGFVLSVLEQEFPNLSLTGCDIYPEAMGFSGKRLARTRLLLADARHLPFKSAFTAIGMFDVLEHIDDDDRVLSEIYLSLAQAGKLILLVPQHRYAWSGADSSASHLRRYEARELKKKLEDAGFEVLASSSFVSLLFPAVLLWRTAGERAPAIRRKASPELDLHPALNFILQRIMGFELFLGRSGVRFPFGASLLMVAQKK